VTDQLRPTSPPATTWSGPLSTGRVAASKHFAKPAAAHLGIRESRRAVRAQCRSSSVGGARCAMVLAGAPAGKAGSCPRGDRAHGVSGAARCGKVNEGFSRRRPAPWRRARLLHPGLVRAAGLSLVVGGGLGVRCRDPVSDSRGVLDRWGSSELAPEAADRDAYGVGERVDVLIPRLFEQAFCAECPGACLEQGLEDREFLGRQVGLPAVPSDGAPERIQFDASPQGPWRSSSSGCAPRPGG
jgi:hypothetical protein